MNLTVTAGPHGYKNCPLQVSVDGRKLDMGEGALVDTDGNRVPCQLSEAGGRALLTWMEPGLEAGQTRTYKFQSEPVAGSTSVEIDEVGEDVLEVKIGGKLFTRYSFGPDYPRPFLYPFVGPNQVQVTRNFPTKTDVPGETHDHPHHRSVWVAYGEVNGTDNWSEGEGHAWIKHQKFEEVSSGPVFGRIRSLNTWTSSDGAAQMSDVREFTFHNIDSERIMDVGVKLIASEGDVALTDTKEGGVISVRVATSMDGDKGGTIVNAYGGRTESETWGKPAHWVDYCGPVDDKTMGIAIMDHPSSFRYPSRWHVRDYGLFTANPFALKYYEPDRGWNGDHTIKSGEELDFKYRLYVHEGDTEQAQVGQRYFGFIAPPRVEVK